MCYCEIVRLLLYFLVDLSKFLPLPFQFSVIENLTVFLYVKSRKRQERSFNNLPYYLEFKRFIKENVD